MSDHSEVEIKWDGQPPSQEVIAKVRQEIKADLSDLARPSDLCFHVVILSDDHGGPSVTLWGVQGDTFGAEYTEHTEWRSLSDFEDDPTPSNN